MGKILLVVLLFAAVVYALFWLFERRRLRKSRARVRRPRIPPKMVAPDDDEDFLRELERRRRAGRDRKKPGPSDIGPTDPQHPSDP